VNQTMLAVPIVLLYLLGVLVSWLFGRPRRTEAEVKAAART
jgi:Sec-independent protein secretion pathway component TatC